MSPLLATSLSPPPSPPLSFTALYSHSFASTNIVTGAVSRLWIRLKTPSVRHVLAAEVEVKTGSKGKEAFQRPLRVTRAFTPTPASVTMPNDFLYQSSWYSHCQPLCSLTYSLHQSPRTGLLTHGQPLLAVTPPLLTHGQPLLAVTPSGLRPSHHSAIVWLMLC